MVLLVPCPSVFYSERDLPIRLINSVCTIHNSYPAHSFCKHPNQALPPGEDWTQYVELIPCEESERAERHARRPEEVYCRHPPWRADTDESLSPFCAQCEHGSHGDTISSATFMWTDFETKKNQWEYRGRLSQQDIQLIQEHIETFRGMYEAETTRGPWNNSYWVLRDGLNAYTAHWEQYVNNKLEAERQQAQKRQEEEMYREARLESSISDAMETVIYTPDQSAQLEALRMGFPGDADEDFPLEEESGSQSQSSGQPGSSSRSHHHRQHKQGLWSEFFFGKKRRK